MKSYFCHKSLLIRCIFVADIHEQVDLTLESSLIFLFHSLLVFYIEINDQSREKKLIKG